MLSGIRLVPIHRAQAPTLRVALYSHDAVGLGHLRRNLLIARTLAGSPLHANVLMVSGAVEARLFPTVPGVDCLTLPALCKVPDGTYRSRSLDVSLTDLGEIRAATIQAAMRSFRPDVLITDKVPRGILGDLVPTLEYLRKHTDAHCVLGLRDILDEPTAVQAEWRRDGNEQAIASYYHSVWVYGDQQVYDLATEYEFGSELRRKIEYVGYLDRRGDACDDDTEDQAESDFDRFVWPDRYILCTLGGGQDGDSVARAFAEAKLPPGLHGVLVTGPYMNAQLRRDLHHRATDKPSLHVFDFVPEPRELIRRAHRVVAMGGHNTVCELLSYEKAALVVPRVTPRTEQLIRAQRLQRLGLVEMCHPDTLSPRALEEWFSRDLRDPRHVRQRVRFDGLDRLPGMVAAAAAERKDARVSAAG